MYFHITLYVLDLDNKCYLTSGTYFSFILYLKLDIVRFRTLSTLVSKTWLNFLKKKSNLLNNNWRQLTTIIPTISPSASRGKGEKLRRRFLAPFLAALFVARNKCARLTWKGSRHFELVFNSCWTSLELVLSTRFGRLTQRTQHTLRLGETVSKSRMCAPTRGMFAPLKDSF